MSDRFRCGGVTVVPAEGRLVGPAGRAHLRPKAMDLLIALAERDGEVAAKGELLASVWGEADVAEAVLTNAVTEVRRAFAVCAGPLSGVAPIETVARRGYRLTEPVQFEAPHADPAHSILVLPLEELTPPEPDDGFAVALQEALADELARQPSLRVLGRSTTARFPARPATLPHLGRALHAGRLLTGSIARCGRRLRIAVRIVDAADERILWSGSASAEAGDPLELPATLAAELAREVVRALAPPAPAGSGAAYPRTGW